MITVTPVFLQAAPATSTAFPGVLRQEHGWTAAEDSNQALMNGACSRLCCAAWLPLLSPSCP